jgi:hypothetical protein
MLPAGCRGPRGAPSGAITAACRGPKGGASVHALRPATQETPPRGPETHQNPHETSPLRLIGSSFPLKEAPKF